MELRLEWQYCICCPDRTSGFNRMNAFPEENVRQAVIRFLTEKQAIPAGLIAIETGIRVEGVMRRADVVVYDRAGQPWMIVECKAPHVSISQSTLNQVANYNRVLGAPYLLVTNGSTNLCAHVTPTNTTFLDALPIWE